MYHTHLMYIFTVHVYCAHILYIHTLHIYHTHIMYIFTVHIYCTPILYAHNVHIYCTYELYTHPVRTYCTYVLYTSTLGLYDRAIEAAQEALLLRPEHSHALRILGHSHRQLGRNDKVEDYYLRWSRACTALHTVGRVSMRSCDSRTNTPGNESDMFP